MLRRYMKSCFSVCDELIFIYHISTQNSHYYFIIPNQFLCFFILRRKNLVCELSLTTNLILDVQTKSKNYCVYIKKEMLTSHLYKLNTHLMLIQIPE